jgi:hypothetical protein
MDVYSEHENFAILRVLFHYESILLSNPHHRRSSMSLGFSLQTCTSRLPQFTCFRLTSS